MRQGKSASRKATRIMFIRCPLIITPARATYSQLFEVATVTPRVGARNAITCSNAVGSVCLHAGVFREKSMLFLRSKCFVYSSLS